MENPLKGRVIWIFAEDNFDIDRIIGVANIRETNVEKLINVCMKEFEEDFTSKVKPGDWIVGGNNFGYGHPHKPPMLVLRHLGIKGVIAESFSPGFYRGQIADGVPLIQCKDILKKVKRFDEIEVDWYGNKIHNKSTDETFNFEPLPETDRKIIEVGGHIEYLKIRLGLESNQLKENV